MEWLNVDVTGLWWGKCLKGLICTKKLRQRLVSRLLNTGSRCCWEAILLYSSFLIYHSENSCPLRNISNNNLLVYYRANTKVWITQTLFEDWFFNWFILSAQHYCLKMEVPCKTFLLLDNAPGHPKYLDDLHPDVQVAYLSKNTTGVLPANGSGRYSYVRSVLLTHDFLQVELSVDFISTSRTNSGVSRLFITGSKNKYLNLKYTIYLYTLHIVYCQEKKQITKQTAMADFIFN